MQIKSKIIIPILIILIITCVFLFQAAYDSVKQQMIRELNVQQRAHARQAAKGIESFFKHYLNSLKFLAENESIINFNEQGKKAMKAFFNSNAGDIKGISRVDAQGKIVYTYPYDKKSIGADISEQEHVRKVLRTHQPVVSDVFEAVQGFRSIAFHVPVFRDKTFAGTIAVLIPFAQISKKYLEDIQIGDNGYAWLLSPKGIELYCPVPGHVGKSIRETSGQFPSVIAMAEEMKKGKTGETIYLYDRVRGNVIETVKKQAVYMPIYFTNTFWSIVVATPEDETLSAMKGFRNNLLLIIVVIIIAIVLISYMLLRAWMIVRETGKRKKIEDALAENEKYLRMITENVQDAIRVIDLKTLKYVYGNQYARDVFGRPNQELIGSVAGASLDEEEKNNLLLLLSEELENDEGKDQNRSALFELKEINKRTGEILWSENKATFIRDASGKPVSILLISRDVTGRKLADEDRRKTSERYRTIIENIEEGYYEVDLQGNMIYCNFSMAKMLGYEQNELIGINNRRYMNEENARNVYKSFHHVYLTGVPEKFLFWELIKKDEGQIFAETSVSLILDESGMPIGFRGIVKDVTERKKIEESLRDSEEKFRLFLEYSPMYVVFKNDRLQMIQLSKNYEKLLGKPVGEMIGKSMQDLFSSDFANKVDEEEREILRSGRSREIEEEVNGRIYSSIKFPIARAGKSSYLAGFIIDITERKHLEGRLNRAEKMEAIGTLAGGVAHDLNNVLGVLVGYSELLLEKIPAGSPLRKYVDNILQSGQRGAAIIQDLLTLARRGVSVSEVVNLNHIIDGYFRTPEFEMLKSYHPQVKFEFALEEDLLNIKGSPVHLSKTVMNLLSNAAESISGRGEVRIQTENCYIDSPVGVYDERQKGDYAVLRVSDTGKGISAKDIGKIFEPFYTKKVMGRSGTGLGLAVVWGTVKDHQGYIDVQSEEEKGSTFTIYFPASRESLAKAEAGIAVEEYLGHGESILVVDDVKEQRELAENMLTRLGYRVATIASGEDAVVYCRNNKTDLIVLDMIMDPGIDGLETYERIIKINPGQKAVIVSGFSETDRVKRAQALGAGAYVRKPYILKKIGMAIRKELDRKTSL